MRWQKFKRPKSELIDDLKTTSSHFLHLADDSTEYPTSLYLVQKSVICNPRRRSIYYVCPTHLNIVGNLNVEESTKGVAFECQASEEAHLLVPSELHNSCFLQVSVKDSLKILLETYPNEVYTCLRQRAESRDARAVRAVSHVTHGYFYRSQQLESTDLTLIVHSDSAEKSHSSTIKGYAIHWTLAELPPELCVSNVILSTLWVSPCSILPHRKVLYNYFNEEMLELAESGISWSHKNEVINSKVYITMVVADAMERFPLAGMSICHALYGCTVCLATTTHWRPPGSTDGRLGKQVFIPGEETATLRSAATTLRLAEVLMSIEDVTLRDETRHDPEFEGKKFLQRCFEFELHGQVFSSRNYGVVSFYWTCKSASSLQLRSRYNA